MAKNLVAKGTSRGTQYKVNHPGLIQIVKGFNIRTKAEVLKDLPELKASILENGVRTPLWVRRDRANKEQPFILIAGERRLTALNQIWEEYETPDFKIPIDIYDVDEEEAELLMLAENMERKDLTPVDEANQVAKWLKMGLTPAEVVERFASVGMQRSEPWVEQRRVLAGASANLKRKVAQGEVLLSVALDIARKVPSAAQSDALDKVLAKAGGKKSKQRKAAAKVTGTAVRPGKKDLMAVMRTLNAATVNGKVDAGEARKLAVRMLAFAAGEATKDEVLKGFMSSLNLKAPPAEPTSPDKSKAPAKSK